MKRFTGKNVIVTGATAGTGRIFAEHFTREGASLSRTGRRERLLAEFGETLRDRFGSALRIFTPDARDRNRKPCHDAR